MSNIVTRAPFPASASAYPRPIPLAPPVTTALQPVTLNRSLMSMFRSFRPVIRLLRRAPIHRSDSQPGSPADELFLDRRAREESRSGSLRNATRHLPENHCE